MRQIGLKPEIMPSMAEEDIEEEEPDKLVLELSRIKAEEIAARYGDDTLVVGADTVVAVQGKILGKPANHREAVEMLLMLQGQVHQVYTGVTVIAGGTKKMLAGFTERTDVFIRWMRMRLSVIRKAVSRWIRQGPMVSRGNLLLMSRKFTEIIIMLWACLWEGFTRN